MNKEFKAIWITWESQPRNKSMSKALNVPLLELVVNGPRWKRYPVLITKTLWSIYKNRCDYLFVQNPSIVLAFISVLVKKIFNKKIYIDTHNAGLFPLEGHSYILNKLAKFIVRGADVIIVSNNYLSAIVKAWGGNAFVMPDPLPEVHSHATHLEKVEKEYVLFICSWATDEPYWEVIESAKHNPDIDIYITGNYKNKIPVEQKNKLPGNIKLLGFVSDHEYIEYFRNASLALDLTTRDHCLVCGAYEAAAIGTPAILSDTIVNRDIFNEGFAYTQNNAIEIAKTVKESLERKNQMADELMTFRDKHRETIRNKISDFKALISHSDD